MLKRLILSLAFAGLISPAFAAGTIPGISMSQQLDSLGNPLNGGKLYLIQAGTTSTPQNCYQDSGLTITWPNPITLDSAGRIPQLFCADGSIKIRLTNSAGVQQLVADGLLVVGPSGGGGGGSSVDATTILATGDFKMVYGTGVLTGFVRCNGKTIGSATSGATERANADTQSLFEYFWGVDTNLAVSGGRGASANADWVANKALTLPDCRGRVLAGLDDMGSSAANRLTSTYWGSLGGCSGASPTTLGVACGSEKNAGLVTANLPPYTPSGSINLNTSGNFGGSFAGFNLTGGASQLYSNGGGPTGLNANPTYNFGGTPQGGTSSPFAVASPSILVTTYIKL